MKYSHLSRTWLIRLINQVAEFESSTAEIVQVILDHISDNYRLKLSLTDKEQEEVQEFYQLIVKDAYHRNWYEALIMSTHDMFSESSSFEEILAFYIKEYSTYLNDGNHLSVEDTDLILKMQGYGYKTIYNFAFVSATNFLNK